MDGKYFGDLDIYDKNRIEEIENALNEKYSTMKKSYETSQQYQQDDRIEKSTTI